MANPETATAQSDRLNWKWKVFVGGYALFVAGIFTSAGYLIMHPDDPKPVPSVETSFSPEPTVTSTANPTVSTRLH